MHYLPTQDAIVFPASSFEEMRQASLVLMLINTISGSRPGKRENLTAAQNVSTAT